MTIVEQFQKFHEDNPEVYAELRKLALQLKEKGRERYGLQALFEVIRWHRAINTIDPVVDFKLPNAHVAGYSRMLMKNEPTLKGFFRTAKSKFDTEVQS